MRRYQFHNGVYLIGLNSIIHLFKNTGKSIKVSHHSNNTSVYHHQQKYSNDRFCHLYRKHQSRVCFYSYFPDGTFQYLEAQSHQDFQSIFGTLGFSQFEKVSYQKRHSKSSAPVPVYKVSFMIF